MRSLESNASAGGGGDDAVHSRVSEDAVVAAVESRGADGATAEELKALAETRGGWRRQGDFRAFEAEARLGASETTKALLRRRKRTNAVSPRRLRARVRRRASRRAEEGGVERSSLRGERLPRDAAVRRRARAARFRLTLKKRLEKGASAASPDDDLAAAVFRRVR